MATVIPDETRRVLVADVAFEPRGYGATCKVCGATVVGDDGQERHRQYHRALAALVDHARSPIVER